MSVTPDPRCCDSYDAHTISCVTDVELSSIEHVTCLTVYASQGHVGNDEFKLVAAVELGKPEGRCIVRTFANRFPFALCNAKFVTVRRERSRALACNLRR
ncbi:hypothetical protein ElyMa_004725900 [Elysia marginata]|uniref:Uncharacterized protein n=1 Tax=Elysia marginata TaxID=1093978 RepID=A0AAV4IA04_9GAST|nr:hypothetical protein ElyMa_004725900 [Elysia marginata]